MKERYDVIVVGARCAGAATALLLARQGHSVLLVDRGRIGDDILSTHYIHEAGIRRLEDWGLLDELRATGCPALTTSRHSIEGVIIEDVTGPDRRVAPYGPRRYVLDALIARAAVAAGAELLERASVRDLLRAGPAVSGIVVTRRHGPPLELKATLVVGSDGARSTVARLAHARTYREYPALTCGYYSYWSDLDCPAGLTIRDRRAAVTVPTHEGMTCVGVAWPRRELPRIRQDIENEYLKVAEQLLPEFSGSPGRQRVERFYGSGDLSGFFREACGPGWALVGDAGHRTDPIAASGITEAFHQAEMLARAAHHGLTHPGAMDDALRSFWKTRDARSDALHRATEVLASLAYSPRTLELIQRPFTDDGQDSLAGILETLGRAGYRS